MADGSVGGFVADDALVDAVALDIADFLASAARFTRDRPGRAFTFFVSVEKAFRVGPQHSEISPDPRGSQVLGELFSVDLLASGVVPPLGLCGKIVEALKPLIESLGLVRFEQITEGGFFLVSVDKRNDDLSHGISLPDVLSTE